MSKVNFASEAESMWRAFFSAVGVSMIIFGAECLALDRVMLTPRKQNPDANRTLMFIPAAQPAAVAREWQPPDWAPWSLMGAGTITLLYSLTLRRGG